MKTILVFAAATFAICLCSKKRLVALLGFVALASTARADTPDQAARWQVAKVNASQTVALDKLVDRWQHTAATYQAVADLKKGTVPAVVLFGLFYREADNDMADSPAQGDPLTHKSRNVPANRIPGKTPPFRWIDAAEDE